jgi:hypothetical protein
MVGRKDGGITFQHTVVRKLLKWIWYKLYWIWGYTQIEISGKRNQWNDTPLGKAVFMRKSAK